MDMRIAVIGGGVAGCSCAWRLARSPHVASVTLFEMGRKAGGRAGTRQTRQIPGLMVNHGAPLFHFSQPSSEVASLLTLLQTSGHLVPWEGTFGMYDVQAMRTMEGWASEGAEPGPKSEVSHFQGAPGMSSMCHGILQCAASKVETRYGIKVSSMMRAGDSQGEPWEVYDQEGNSLGQFDWVVVTSASLGHEYNAKRLFGDAPLLHAAAQSTVFSELHDAVRHITGTYSASPRHVAMMAWPTSQEVVETLRQLPYDVTVIEESDVLSRVVRQSLDEPYLVVVVHSTEEFSMVNWGTIGSAGMASSMRLEGSLGTLTGEQAVLDEMVNAFQVMVSQIAGRPLPKPEWGPCLHRWGAAFPNATYGLDKCDEQQSLLFPRARVAVAGDFLSQPRGTIEGAMQSGLEAASGVLRALVVTPGPVGA